MAKFFQEVREGLARVPGLFRAALGLAAGFMAFVAWDQSHWWSAKADYSFGWLVPAFVIFVVYDRWPKITAALARCVEVGSVRAKKWRGWVLGAAVGTMLALGAGFFLLGSFYRAGAGSSQPGTLAITLGMIGVVLPLLWLNAPDSAQPVAGGIFADARVRLAGLFVFPVLVWLVSAPMVSVVENQLSLFLLHKVVTVVSFVFDMLGLPVGQQGNVLVLPNGSVGVEDACSGIRSLTGCLFAGSFLAAVFVDRLWQKVTLVVAAMGFAFVTNLARGLFLTGWAYSYGSRAIEGTVHDVAGYAVLGLTVAGLLCVLPIITLKVGSAASDGAVAQTKSES
ncbi:MAG: exosortase/archaeosortase family protein [Undibacterium sp.]|nr:exosortase/archaeosortase family protein [Opitutaceae bacterium]